VSRGVVAFSLVALGGLLAGCGKEPVTIDAPAPSGTAGDRCAALVEALPDDVADQHRRLVSPAAAPGAAWGDPPIVLTCGGDWKADPGAPCMDVNGVGWTAPEAQVLDLNRADQAGPATLTTYGWSPAVRVQVPADYNPPAAVMVDLASAIKETLHRDRAC